MAVQISMEPDWEDHVLAATDQLFEDKLGPAIAGDAERYAPERTGELKHDISHRLDGHDLVVEDSAPYAAYVELGHRIAHGPRMREVGPKIEHPEPYLRPALFQERGDE